MYPIATQHAPGLIELAAILAITGCMVVWALVAVRWRQGRRTVPYQPRRRVPWGTLEVAAVVAFYLLAQSATFGTALAVFDAGSPPLSAAGQHDESTSAHVVVQLISENNGWILLLCLVAAVVVTPVAEEFFFRVLLQGWLESGEHRWQRYFGTWRRLIPRGIIPIVPTAMLFAAMHFRLSSPPVNANRLLLALASNAVANVLTLVFAVEWLRWRVGASAADLGWTPGHTRGDVKLGIGAFAAVAAPIYALQLALHHYLPKHIAPDPLPLLLLALMLGVLYYRTHRILPSIVLHAALNCTSLLLPLLS